jgi:dipeptidyl aminopeptidase/acylaminoacyl peptidase
MSDAIADRMAPYGSWKSPITGDLVARKAITLGQIRLDGQDLYWYEMRPAEGGRYAIVRRTPDGTIRDALPEEFNARTLAHEYGGGAYMVAAGTIYFSNYADQRLYRQDPGGVPKPITPTGAVRYADAVIDPRRNRLICIREDHTTNGREAVNILIALDLKGSGEQKVLASGNTFYSSPALSPDASRLAWLTWNHPNMPWDGSELWLADIAPDGGVRNARKVAGGEEESIFQPAFSPNGVLHFVSDRTGWWNLYRLRDQGVEALAPMEAEFGKPQWVFGSTTYAFDSERRIVCSVTERGMDRLATIDTRTLELKPLDTPYSHVASLQAARGKVVFLGGSPTEPQSLLVVDLNTRQTVVVRRAIEVAVDPHYISTPQPIEFPTEGGRTAHAFFYPPHNRDFSVPVGELPPLLVLSHGGPTSQTTAVFSLSIQYWTSRGFAVVDVNYGGSTGYGRAYRLRLNGQWGVVDVDDCVHAARYLAERGLVDQQRLIIRGGSAGGYTTLCALVYRDTFKAGADYFGLSELVTFVRDTHKFESRYLDRLVGPYPEQRALYQQRSPIDHIDRVTCPVIVFQGLEDKIVPPNQSELIVQALRKNGIPVAYLTFEGEQHGFRRAETIKRTLEAELYFYGRVFGFELAEPVEPVRIENLKRRTTP